MCVSSLIVCCCPPPLLPPGVVGLLTIYSTNTHQKTHNAQADSFYGHEGGHATRDFMPVGACRVAWLFMHACMHL